MHKIAVLLAMSMMVAPSLSHRIINDNEVTIRVSIEP